MYAYSSRGTGAGLLVGNIFSNNASWEAGASHGSARLNNEDSSSRTFKISIYQLTG